MAVTSTQNSLLIMDKIQKIADWDNFVRRLWDEDSGRERPAKIVILGSAPLLSQQGLTESLGDDLKSFVTPNKQG